MYDLELAFMSWEMKLSPIDDTKENAHLIRNEKTFPPLMHWFIDIASHCNLSVSLSSFLDAVRLHPSIFHLFLFVFLVAYVSFSSVSWENITY